MKLKSRARRIAKTIKQKDYSLQPNASSEARVLVPGATLSVKQESDSYTLLKQEEPFASTLVSNNTQVEPNEELDKTIKQEETLKPKTELDSNKDAIIDINHPNFYCSRCEKSLANRSYFKTHLIKMHKMRLPTRKYRVKKKK